MIPADARLFHPKGPDHAAVVWVEPAYGRADAWLLRLARGPKLGKLSAGTTYGPYSEAELSAPHAQLVAALLAEGFLPSGVHGAMAGLFSDSVATRGLAAERLGWSGHAGAADALLGLLPKASGETCAIIDALGRLGDPRAIPAIRPYAARKLLSRRRSAVEALRNLGDGEGLVAVRARTLEELPPAVREALLPVEAQEPTAEQVAKLVTAAKTVEPLRLGQVADLLFERFTPAAISAATTLIGEMAFDQPFVWRYVKSILKRSMLRGDHRTFGWLMHEIERRGRDTAGVMATVKSGYDGVERPTRIFGRKTQNYVRRAGWRYLRRLARHRPQAYAPAAAEVLLHYTEDDAALPDKKYGAFARCYLMHRILWGGSKRFTFNGRSMKFAVAGSKQVMPPPDVREESYPALWDAQPAAYVRLLAASRLADVQEFAVRGIGRHPEVLRGASVEDLIGMLESPFETAVNLAMTEISRRLESGPPSWPLVERLAANERAHVREFGQRFLRDHVALWAWDVDRVVRLLLSPNASTRALVAELTILRLQTDNAHHRELAERLLAILRAPEMEPGMHESLARVCREALLDTLAAMLATDELLGCIANGSPAAQGVAGDLLGRRPEAMAALGLERITALAQHELGAVRAAGQAMIRAAREYWTNDPSVLLALLESDWDDTRAVALNLIENSLDFERLGTGVLLGMLDSNRVEVQNSAIDLARRHFVQLDPGDLVNRLVEHPHPHMRPFALELVIQHLPDGAAPLARVERFCRTALLEVWPQRRAKNDVISFLCARGLRDEEQARIASRILGEILRVEARCDFDRALEALVRIKLAWPRIEAPVGLPEALVGGGS